MTLLSIFMDNSLRLDFDPVDFFYSVVESFWNVLIMAIIYLMGIKVIKKPVEFIIYFIYLAFGTYIIYYILFYLYMIFLYSHLTPYADFESLSIGISIFCHIMATTLYFWIRKNSDKHSNSSGQAN